MGVSKNRGTPKWMVKIMENPMKMDDLEVPLFSETSIYQKDLVIQLSTGILIKDTFEGTITYPGNPGPYSRYF